MPEQDNSTVLQSITDNLVDNFFEGGASSKNVLSVQEAVKEEKDDDKDKKKDPIEVSIDERLKNSGFVSKEPKLSAAEIFGADLNEVKENEVKPEDKSTEEESKVTVKESTNEFNKLIEAGVLAPFEDDSPIKDIKDLETLIKGNKEYWVSEAKANAIKELSDNLPEEVKYLMEYASKGGQDLKSIFKLLSQTQEFKDFDTETDAGQKALIRAYYAAQDWSEDEIEEEIVNLSDSKQLQRHAERLKPKLERINQEELARRKQQQDLIEKEQAKAKEFFTHNVVDTLKKGKVGGLTLTKQEQEDVYSALVKEQYNSFGNVTNRLGALLDKIQYVEPNYELLAEVTMLLTNPEDYKKKIRDQINTEVTADQVKKIKIEQNKKKIGSDYQPDKENKTMPRLSSNFISPFK